LEERIDLVVVAEEKRKPGGLSLSVIISLVLHSVLILIVWWVRSSQSTAPAARDLPMARYVELMQQNPQDFVEAPGPERDRAPMTAPLSDKNRSASMPEPTGVTPTKRPGDGGGLYTPPSDPRPRAPQQASIAPSAPAQQQQQSQQQQAVQPPTTTPSDPMIYREPVKASASAGTVDWNSAIKEVGKVASLGGGQGLDLEKIGGERGTAEQGPLSFETQWYDWGNYAQSMVSRIRVNWYGNMPQIIRSGMKGVVTIRFTIQRDGRITDIQTLESSEIPPYDFAARKAIELSSPLNPLPKDFPKQSERVTAMFYYNTDIPGQ
jgi:TonB family protein